jgi:hypothetical protein
VVFDDNPDAGSLRTGPTKEFFARLSEVTQEYSLLQIVKLHDPATQQGRCNLTLDYMVRFGGWDAATRAELEKVKARLDSFAANIRPARNHALSHNDLEFILKGDAEGDFPDGEDQAYFKALEEFVDIVARAALGTPFPFCVMADGDAGYFVQLVNFGREAVRVARGDPP